MSGRATALEDFMGDAGPPPPFPVPNWGRTITQHDKEAISQAGYLIGQTELEWMDVAGGGPHITTRNWFICTAGGERRYGSAGPGGMCGECAARKKNDTRLKYVICGLLGGWFVITAMPYILAGVFLGVVVLVQRLKSKPPKEE